RAQHKPVAARSNIAAHSIPPRTQRAAAHGGKPRYSQKRSSRHKTQESRLAPRSPALLFPATSYPLQESRSCSPPYTSVKHFGRQKVVPSESADFTNISQKQKSAVDFSTAL